MGIEEEVAVIRTEVKEIKNDIHEIKERLKVIEHKFDNIHRIDMDVGKILSLIHI